MNKIISLIMTVIIGVSSIISGFLGKDFEHSVQKGNGYKTVFVHGFNGFGEGSSANDVAAYWGGGSVDLILRLNEMGYDCASATVGPLSSCWDRACELYAQLTGTTVDYGEAHSKEHNHARYGRTYDTALMPDWSETDKVNLIGHSFGGTTIRLMVALLADGDEAERSATKDGSISPLFEGGKSKLVNSVTTVASPTNGTTLIYVAKKLNMMEIFETLTYVFAGTSSKGALNGVFDFRLDQFDIEKNEAESNIEYMVRATKYLVEQCKNDSAYYDMSPEGAREINDRCRTLKDVYFYSAPYCTTKENSSGNSVPVKSTFALLRPLARILGKYKENNETDYEIDETWLPNDGLVNTISEICPFGEKYVDFNYGDTAEKGVWNVFPTVEGDHGYAAGLLRGADNVLEYYTALVDQVNS